MAESLCASTDPFTDPSHTVVSGLRPATEDDREPVLRWRNHPEVRRASLTGHVIGADEHRSWWRATSNDDHSHVLIFERAGSPCGVVTYRVDPADRSAVWGYYLDIEGLSARREFLPAWLELEREAIGYAFDVLGLDRIGGATLAWNSQVLALHRRFGFRETRRYRQSVDGTPQEVVWMELRADAQRRSSRADTPSLMGVPARDGASAPDGVRAREGVRGRSFLVDGRPVGAGARPYVVAEMSGNHNGSLDRALALVDAVADAGAHALKLQTYTADTLTVNVDHPRFRVSTGHDLWSGEHLYQLFERAHTPWDWHEPIFDRARARGLTVFSSPFDPTAVELLEKLDAPLYKIASSEIVDLPLIRLVAATGKPVIISTGMATVTEIGAAVQAARDAGCADLVLLACTASYPAPPDASNLRRLPVLAAAFGVPVGLSDHTIGVGVPLGAVALGACLIEKHVTLDRADGGVDSAFSLEPDELATLVAESERVWRALGSDTIGPTAAEAEGLRFRRSLYVVRDVRAGEPATEANVRSIRPAGGLPPDAIGAVLGRAFRRDAAKGTPLSWDMI